MKNKFNFLIFILLVVFINCKKDSQDITEYIPERQELYFPINVEKNKDKPDVKFDTLQNRLYSMHLFSLNEPILYKQKGDIEIYRFTILSTLFNTFSYRVLKSDSICTIIKKESEGQGNYEVGDLIYKETKEIPLSEWNILKSKISKIDFWNAPTQINYRGYDGEEWILEGYQNGTYHFMIRWTPDQKDSKDFLEACEYFGQIFNENN